MLDKGLDVYLQPGDFHFAGQNTRIHTLLGSCIAIALWHPQKRIGGMCHYMLPSSRLHKKSMPYDGKYADDAIKMFLQQIQKAGTEPSEYQAKIFGGGNMFPQTYGASECYSSLSSCNHVGCQNTEMAHQLVAEHGFKLAAHDVGGTKHRKILFDIASGDVWLRTGD